MSVKNILNSGSNFDDRLILDYKELAETVQNLKDMDYRVVLTQGVYDLVHEGHALYLEKARSLGDVLIVGVDSDELTRQRKGPSRPIVPQKERLNMLVHLRHVDIVTVRDVHHSIDELIRTVRPHVLVTSDTTKDFSKEDAMIYKDCCGEVIVLSAQATATTTGRIRTLAIDGANEFLGALMSTIPELFKKHFNLDK